MYFALGGVIQNSIVNQSNVGWCDLIWYQLSDPRVNFLLIAYFGIAYFGIKKISELTIKSCQLHAWHNASGIERNVVGYEQFLIDPAFTRV